VGINAPTTPKRATEILWQLYHEGVSVCRDEKEWYVQFEARCRNLGEGNLCSVYANRPHICRAFDSETCEVNAPEGGLITFREPQQFLDYLRRKRPKVYRTIEKAPTCRPRTRPAPWVETLDRRRERGFAERIPAMTDADRSQPFTIRGRAFTSRLIVGTGKYPSFEIMQGAHEAAGADMVTVAVRRVDLKAPQGAGTLLDFIDRKKIFILPNTAACYTADDAVRTARLGREAGLSEWVKLEVIGDPKTLYPDVVGLLEATKILVGEGFVVLPYTTDDVVMAKRLEDAGAAAVMPLGAPIGSGLGIQNPVNIELIREAISVPLIVDAGVGTASDAAIAMELGADGVLMNTAIAEAQDSVLMARAMRHAVLAGREAFLAGRMPRRKYASASSPLQGVVGR
jgi:thiazole synthase